MSKRKKGRTHRQADSIQSSIQRDLDNGRFKDAVKNARVAFRKDAGPVIRALLQRACLWRAEQLHQAGLLQQARDVFEEFERVGEPAGDLSRRADRLRVLLGMATAKNGRAADDLLAEESGLRVEVADQAVLNGPAASLPAEVRQHAEQVRAALHAIERDDAGREAVALPEIDRKSPFAEWKLFARGLSAFYAGDDERALANWGRLDSSRPAYRIAQALLVHAGIVRESEVSSEIRAGARRLIVADGEDAIVPELRLFKRHWDAGDWRTLVREYSKLVRRFRKSHPDLVEKLGNILSRRVLKEERVAEHHRLAREGVGPPLDPRFRRVAALGAEQYEDWETAEEEWLAFIDELQGNSQLTERDRSLAIGLVYERLAENSASAARDYGSAVPGDWREEEDEEEDEVLQRLRAEATEYFEKSLEQAPSLRDTYLTYSATLREFGAPPADVQDIFERLLRRFPDDHVSLLYASAHCLEIEDYEAAKAYALAARKLQPRDDRVLTGLWSATIGMARVAARNKELAEARALLDEAETLIGGGRERYVIDAYRAGIEFKAGNAKRAEEHLQAALAHFDQPAAGLFIVSAQAFRVGVSRQVRSDLNFRLEQELARGRKTGQAAGAMARFMNALERTGTSYHGIRKHSRMVHAYIKGCPRSSWEAKDLVAACEFLHDDRERQGTFSRLVQWGLKKFRNEPYFHFAIGESEIERGRLACNRPRARAALERAIELSKTAERPLNEEQRNQASGFLGLLHGPAPFAPDLDFFGDEEEDLEDDQSPFAGLDPSEIDIEEVLETMPPHLRRKARQMEKQTGITGQVPPLRRGLRYDPGAVPHGEGRGTGQPGNDDRPPRVQGSHRPAAAEDDPVCGRRPGRRENDRSKHGQGHSGRRLQPHADGPSTARGAIGP